MIEKGLERFGFILRRKPYSVSLDFIERVIKFCKWNYRYELAQEEFSKRFYDDDENYNKILWDMKYSPDYCLEELEKIEGVRFDTF